MKTREINNKYYIDAKVVMLDTKNSSPIQYVDESNLLLDSKPKTLYITFNEKIKEGDTVINNLDNLIGKCIRQITQAEIDDEEYSKIIASTDLSLKLPQPSKEFIQSFIESYDKGEVITDVLVEVEYLQEMYEEIKYFTQLKLKDNIIIIKKKEDRMFTLDDMKKACACGIDIAVKKGGNDFQPFEDLINSLI